MFDPLGANLFAACPRASGRPWVKKLPRTKKCLVFNFREGLFLCQKPKIQNFQSCVVLLNVIILNVVIASVMVPIIHTSITNIIQLKVRWRSHKTFSRNLESNLKWCSLLTESTFVNTITGEFNQFINRKCGHNLNKYLLIFHFQSTCI